MFKLVIPEYEGDNRIRRIFGISRIKLFLHSFVDRVVMFIIPIGISFLGAQVASLIRSKRGYELASTVGILAAIFLIITLISFFQTRKIVKRTLAIK